MLISIHDSVHYNTVHVSEEVLIGRQLTLAVVNRSRKIRDKRQYYNKYCHSRQIVHCF